MADHFPTAEDIDDDAPTAFVIHTYGDATTSFDEGEFDDWEAQTDVTLTDVTRTSGDSTGNTLNVVSTARLAGCTTGSQIVVESVVISQILTITAVVDSTTLTVSDIDGTIPTGYYVKCGFVLDCKGGTYNDHCTISGATASSDYFRMIRRADGESAVTFHCTDSLATSPYSVFYVNSESYFTFKNLTVTATQNDAHAIRGIWLYDAGNSKIINCEIPGIINTGGDEWAIEVSNSSSGVIRNCLIRDCTQGINCQVASPLIYNTTIVDCDYAIERRTSGTPVATNCIFYSSNTADILGTSVTQTNCNTDESVTFEDYSGDDYHLDDTDTGAINQGTQLYSDSDNSFFYDKDGVFREAAWDIGCYENTATSDTTWYVRESGSTYGDADGTSYANAWAGTDNIDIDDLASGDTLYICGDHLPFVLEDFIFDEINIRGDYPSDPCTISGLRTIASGDWTLVSGSLYKAEITDYEGYDYEQATMPVSPTTGDTWFSQGYNSSYKDFNGRAHIHDGTNWVPYQFFERPQIVVVDDGITQPAIFGPYDYDAGSLNDTTVTDTTNLTQADNYWIGSLLTKGPTRWLRESLEITDSVQSTGVVTHTETQVPYDGLGNLEAYYIENVPPGLIDTDYEWSFQVESGTGYLYMQLPSTTGQTVQYAGAGNGILLMDCAGVHLSGFTIEYCNDCGVLACNSPETEISNNTIQYCAPLTASYYYGMISFVSNGTDSDDAEDGPWFNSCNNNTISYLQSGGVGVYTFQTPYSTVDYNKISSMRVFPNLKGRSRGVFLRSSDNYVIDWNEIYYSGYSSISTFDFLYGEITNNLCSHALYDLHDGGAIYINATMSVSVDTSGIISGNRIEHIHSDFVNMVSGVYVDWYTNHMSITENYFYDLGSTVTCFQNNQISIHNDASDNYIYDSDCVIEYKDWVDDGNTASDNDRYSENDYPFLNEPQIIWFLR